MPALELFVGFSSDEIEYLEKHVLFYLRDSLKSFIAKVNPKNEANMSDQGLQSKRGDTFRSYNFRSEDTQSFGRDDLGNKQVASNPFEPMHNADI